jgi:hypothetical protein
VLRAVELLDLPDNRISAIRGVGKQVALEILEFRRRWTALAKVTLATSEPAFFPGYRGDDLMIHLAGLASATAERLADAGLRSLAVVAAAPRTQLANLARTAGLDEAAIRATLSAEHAKAAVRSQPTTLGAWCDALLPAKKRYQHARELFGLDGPRVGVVGTSPRELADLLQLTPAAIYLALGKARDEWAKHPAIATLAATVHAVVERAGGAVPLARAGIELLSELPHAGEPDAEVRAAALVRLVADLEKDDPAGLRFVRLDGDAPWIVLRDDLEDVVRRLGTTADELAGRDVLAGPAEVARALTEIVDATPLAGLSADRLVRLAAAASRRAAASTRLELYPRDLTPARTLELSAAVLTSPLAEDELRRRVAARYPDAPPLPPRPALDDLVASFGLRYLPADAAFVRPGDDARSSIHTSVRSPLTTFTRVRPAAEISAREVAIAEFDDRVRLCLARRALLVLGVTADQAGVAERTLAARHGLAPRSFDALFLAELERIMARERISPDLVYRTDGAGRADDAWPRLRKLAEATATAIAGALLPPAAPLLITQPGLIGRYGLVGFLERLVASARDDDAGQAIVLLIPGHEGGRPMIGEVAVPGLLPGQYAWIPRPWLSEHAPKAA